MFFSLFPKTASSSVFIIDDDSVLIASEPHFGQRTGAYPVGKRPDYKKAIVTLTADSKTIEFFEGMV